jgi:predicted nuclease of predicted toxin-antitoxin system
VSRFLVDAQLPLRLALFIRSAGLDAVHTLELTLTDTEGKLRGYLDELGLA